MNYSVKREISQVLQDPRLDLKILSKPELIVKQIEQWLLIWGKWNDKIGLTAEKDPMAVVQQHFFGSLLYRQGLGKIKNLLDIGSGAGFPGIPLKLVEPDLAITLVESQRKRAGFLQETVRSLKLSDVQIINERAEKLGAEHQRKYDAIVFRYVDQVETCLALAEPYLNFSGRVVIIKEPEYQSNPGIMQLNCKSEIPVQSWSGTKSKLMVFGGCST